MIYDTIVFFRLCYTITMSKKNLSPLGFVSILWNERHDVASRMGYVYAPTYDECYALMSAELAVGDDYYGANMGSMPVAIESFEGLDWRVSPIEYSLCTEEYVYE